MEKDVLAWLGRPFAWEQPRGKRIATPARALARNDGGCGHHRRLTYAAVIASHFEEWRGNPFPRRPVLQNVHNLKASFQTI